MATVSATTSAHPFVPAAISTQTAQVVNLAKLLFYQVPTPGTIAYKEFPPFGAQPIVSDEVVQAYLEFFEREGHTIYKNASLLPDNDPTLLFINSGVAALKPFFGQVAPPAKRLANIQTCIRTGDIDDVGDPRHLTLFHMLGNWSFNDYTKDTAIELAYNFAVNVCKIPKERLYATAFSGDAALGLPRDDEAAAAWEKMGIPKERILFFPKEDNFWGPAGTVGPCGPCSELFFDRGADFGVDYDPANPKTFETDRYREIWNPCVAMTLNKDEKGNYTPLTEKGIDAGAGLERFCETLNGCRSVYDTDLLKPIVEWVGEFLGPDASEHQIRMVTDHLRTSCYILAEGVVPGPTGQEYVLRRLIRKCAAAVISLKGNLNFESVLNQMIPFIGQINPKVSGNREFIIAQINKEAKQCENTIRKAQKEIEPLIKQGTQFPGDKAHHIETTYGLPLELLKLHIREHHMTLDEAGYKAAKEAHKKASKTAEVEAAASATAELYKKHLQNTASTHFKGYEGLQASSPVTHLFVNGEAVESVKTGDIFEFTVIDTPFYARGGGQVGDKGAAENINCKIQVLDTVQEQGVFIHHAKVTAGMLQVHDTLNLSVDPEHRAGARRNHSATHLLQGGIRQVLGIAQGVQRGSLVEPEKLRFDFAYTEPLTQRKVEGIQNFVNEQIRLNLPVQTQVIPFAEAKGQGALSMTGEQYPEMVRLVTMGDSKELCGGTHVSSTGEINAFRIIQSKSSKMGEKRIVAVTGPEALKVPEKVERSVSKKMESTLSITAQRSIAQKVTLYAFTGSPKAAEDFIDNELKQNPDRLIGALSFEEETDKLTFLFKVNETGARLGLSAKAQLQSLADRFGAKGGGTDLRAQGGMQSPRVVGELFSMSDEEIKKILFPK